MHIFVKLVLFMCICIYIYLYILYVTINKHLPIYCFEIREPVAFHFEVNRSCRKTALAPTYGGPITRMTPVYAEADGEEQFMLYATHEKVLGLVQLPLDGNPNKCMGLIAHPGQIAAISVDYQGQYAFTCGGNDLTVNQWLIDPQPVANASVMGGGGIEPFVKLLDGGEDGAFFCDMKDGQKNLLPLVKCVDFVGSPRWE